MHVLSPQGTMPSQNNMPSPQGTMLRLYHAPDPAGAPERVGNHLAVGLALRGVHRPEERIDQLVARPPPQLAKPVAEHESAHGLSDYCSCSHIHRRGRRASGSPRGPV